MCAADDDSVTVRLNVFTRTSGMVRPAGKPSGYNAGSRRLYEAETIGVGSAVGGV